MIKEEDNNKPENKIPNINDNSKGAREWFPYDHYVTGRRYIIRYFYEEEDTERRCTVSLESNNPQKEEIPVGSFKYPANRQGIDVDEKAKMMAIGHGNMQPPEDLS